MGGGGGGSSSAWCSWALRNCFLALSKALYKAEISGTVSLHRRDTMCYTVTSMAAADGGGGAEGSLG